MARTKIKQMGNQQRHTYTGTFIKYDYKNQGMGHYAPTLLLGDVVDELGHRVTDHLRTATDCFPIGT